VVDLDEDASALARVIEVEVRRTTGSAVRQIAWERPRQLMLRTLYEARGVRRRLAPAPDRGGPTPKIDPWAVHLQHPVDAAVGAELSVAPADATCRVDCAVCSGDGDVICPACDGARQLPPSGACTLCASRGRFACEECRGSGSFVGDVVVWSRIAQHEDIRTLGARRLPTDVAADIAGEARGGAVVHRVEGQRVEGLVLPSGYRDAGGADEPLVDAARQLCERPGIDPDARILQQVLEVRRVTVARVSLDSGDEVWCWGQPLRVWPAQAREGAWRRRAARSLPRMADFAVALVSTTLSKTLAKARVADASKSRSKGSTRAGESRSSGPKGRDET